MRWINFIILVAVIVKYAREPIKDFLKLRKEEVVSQIDELNGKKTRILDEIKSAKQQGVENQTRLKALKVRLISQGENRKKQIIEQARQQSVIMLEETRRKMENRIVQAKARLKMELLDIAMDQAVKKLPELITERDNQQFLDDYMRSLQS
jgi:F-type H+-transporting ATPase subunit b